MKTRLVIFVITLLALPAAGLLLGGRDWNELAVLMPAAADDVAATVATLLGLLCYFLLTNLVVMLGTGHNPFTLQRNFFLALGAASAVLGWLLSYLNLFTASWSTAGADTPLQVLGDTLLFALLVPAVLNTRAMFGLSSRLLKALAHGPAVPALPDETLIYVLMPVTVFGLLGGAAWPEQLFWLFWLAPLLLLAALQLLWRESTVFSGLKSGDWGRVLLGILAGIMVGNLATFGFQVAGGSLSLSSTSQVFAQTGYAVFGLLSLQVGDVIAEHWRGTQRSEMFQRKTKFPIPVVTKKK